MRPKHARSAAGTILGAGTVSNRDSDGGPGKPISEGGLGYSCLAEQRTVETIRNGKPSTPFLKFGDRVRIEMLDTDGRSIFGAIEQEVVRYTAEIRLATCDGQGGHGKRICVERRYCREEDLVRRDRPRALRVHCRGRSEFRHHRRRRRRDGGRCAGDAGDGAGSDRARPQGHRQADQICAAEPLSRRAGARRVGLCGCRDSRVRRHARR